MGNTISSLRSLHGSSHTNSAGDALRPSPLSIDMIERREPKLQPHQVHHLGLEPHAIYAILSADVYAASGGADASPSPGPQGHSNEFGSSSTTKGEPAAAGGGAAEPTPSGLLPPGWEVYLKAGDIGLEAMGFFAVAYLHRRRKHCIIAYRGTVDLSGLRTGIWVFCREPSATLQLAARFSIRVRETLWSEFGIGPTRGSGEGGVWREPGKADGGTAPFTFIPALPEGFALSHTGHSLGAVLATVRAVEEGVPAVAFDSPGCAALVNRILRDNERRVQQWRRREKVRRLQQKRQAQTVAQPAPPAVVQQTATATPQRLTKPPTGDDDEPVRLRRREDGGAAPSEQQIHAMAMLVPEALVTNYLQPPNIINTLRPQFGYSMMIPPAPGERDPVVAAFYRLEQKGRKAAWQLGQDEGSSLKRRALDDDDDSAPTSSSSDWLSTIQRPFQSVVQYIPSPVQYMRDTILGSLGVSTVAREVLCCVEPELWEMASYTRQQHSIQSIARYFRSYQALALLEGSMEKGEYTPGIPRSSAKQPVVKAPVEVMTWPQNTLQYVEYLRVSGAQQSGEVHNTDISLAFDAMKRTYFEVAPVIGSGGAQTESPLSERYLPVVVVEMVLTWEHHLSPLERQQLPLTPLDHAVLNIVHLAPTDRPAVEEGDDEVKKSERSLWVEREVLTPLQARNYLFHLAHRKELQPWICVNHLHLNLSAGAPCRRQSRL